MKKSNVAARKLDRNDASPLYLQLKDRLIAEYHQRAGDAPLSLSDADLMLRYGVSRPTVRAAVAELVRAGMVTRVPGRGTFFVPREKLSIGLDSLDRFFAEWHLAGLDPGSRILAYETVGAPPDVAERLHVAAGDEVLMLRRLRTANGMPATVDRRYVVSWCAKHISRADAERDLLFNILAKRAATPSIAVEQEVGAVAADAATALVLDVAIGTPLVSRDVTIFTTGNRPIITGSGFYRSDRFRFRIRAER